MKTSALCWLLACAGCISALGQQYSIEPYKVAGGGGASAGGTFSLSGTIGQVDTGALRGGQFALEGGFWAVAAVVPRPGSPPLRIASAGTDGVVLAWPAASTGFRLQQISALGTTNWISVTNAVGVVNGENQVRIPSPAGYAFFRLINP